jgi:Cu2+-exporting ATPase
VNGLLIEVGKPAFIRELADDPQNLLSQLDESSCSTHIAIAVDSEIRAVAALDDQLREDSEQAVRHLIDTGWNVRILSGDSYAAALNVGRTLGLRDEQIIAEATPEQKLEVIKSSQLHSVTVMVGDGVNDAAALAASDVGIAVHGGAEASLAAADMYLSKPGIASVTQLIDGCARTMTVIHRNLIVSILYNAGAAVLAITGFIHPIVAAVLMPVSSLTVIFLAFKSRSFGVRS